MRVVFSGGGTGGHIYPAVAIAKSVLNLCPDAEILFIGAERGMETTLIPKEGFPLETLRVVGLSRSNPLQAARSLWWAGQGLLQARRIVRGFNPDVAVGTGGYASGPAIMAAAGLGVPTLIHEQNAYPGLTTRWLSRVASVVATSHQEAGARLPKAKRIEVTGMPIRQEFYHTDRAEGRKRLGLPPDAKVVMSVGGSGGALKLNQAVANCAQRLLQDPQLYLLQVAGERYFNMVSEWRETSNRADHRWQVIRFMYDMPHALAAADLVISRAGASTMEEIAACGVPAIFIPSPNVTDNHQEHNANALARQGAALVIREQMLSADNLAANIEDILGDKTRWNQMAAASKAASHPGATLRLGQLVLALARG